MKITQKAENTAKARIWASRITQEKEENELRGMRYGLFGSNQNELRSMVRNCWHEGLETTENEKRNRKKGVCSKDTLVGTRLQGGTEV